MILTYFNLSNFLFGFSFGWLSLWGIGKIIERRREKRYKRLYKEGFICLNEMRAKEN